MKYNYFNNSIEITKQIINSHVKIGDKILDCTVGNGNDTVLLAKLVGKTGMVYGFDIQPIALKRTTSKLLKCGLDNGVKLINDSHENIDHYITDKLNLIIYNLGYLPNGNKKIKTITSTTIASIRKSLLMLAYSGILLVTCYTGHNGGLEEAKAVKNCLKSLNQKEYNVLEFNFINQQNNPPILYMVEKCKKQEVKK